MNLEYADEMKSGEGQEWGIDEWECSVVSWQISCNVYGFWDKLSGKGPRITHFQNFIAFILHPIIRSKINKVFSDGSNRDASIVNWPLSSVEGHKKGQVQLNLWTKVYLQFLNFLLVNMPSS
jgi:hypothetical protein